jgi:hypothetical protein
LEDGAQRTRAESERRRRARREVQKAEPIEGVVNKVARVSNENQGRPDARLIGGLDRGVEGTPGVEVTDHSSIRLDLDQLPQAGAPRSFLPEPGGRLRVPTGGDAAGAAERVVAVASRNASLAPHEPRPVSRGNEVVAHGVWRTCAGAIAWYVLGGWRHERQAPGPDGLLRRPEFSGVWLDPAALLRGDRAAVPRVLPQGLASAAHAKFVAGLTARAAAGERLG